MSFLLLPPILVPVIAGLVLLLVRKTDISQGIFIMAGRKGIARNPVCPHNKYLFPIDNETEFTIITRTRRAL